MIRRLLCAVVVLAAAVAAHAEPLKLAPKYDETGTNPDGSKYTGTVAISVVSDTTFTIQWTIGGETYRGFGMRMNDSLAATYMINGQPGLVIYKVEDTGTLHGLWTVRGENGNGTDILIPHQ
jgi:hypothetical protein